MSHGKVALMTSAALFKETIAKNAVVIVDFFAVWCGPCKVISPKFEAFSTVYTSVKFVSVDVDEVPEVSEEAGIRAMPTFMVYKDGKKVDEVVGADPKRLEAVIQKYASA